MLRRAAAFSRDRPAAPPRARQDHAPPEEDVAEAAHRGTTDSRPGSVEPCGAGGGWFEYPFPKPGEERPSRKVTYMLAVPGTPYVVGAGVYDETVTLEPLRAVSGEQR